MIRKISRILLAAVAISLLVVLPALAAAPETGTVVEGQSVPGVSLGDTRAQVEASYGSPSFCQSVEVGGDMASCTFQVNGGGQATVRYRGPNGGNAGNSPNDVVHNVRWTEPASGWTTTAGVNTALAAADPDAVAAAYPNAAVTYNAFGLIHSVIDYGLGIEVLWSFNPYSGTTSISMAIFGSATPPPPQEKVVTVESIDLSAYKEKGKRKVTAFVLVRNEQSLAAQGATVSAHWELPGGETLQAQAVTSSAGYAYFEVIGGPRGTYNFEVDDVVLANYTFDAGNSVLTGSIKVR